MRDFTPDEVAAFRAEAMTKFQGRVLGIELEDPIRQRFVCAPFDRAAYQDFWRAAMTDAQSACATVYTMRTIYPSLVDRAVVASEWASAPEKVAKRLELEAMGTGGSATHTIFAAPPAPPADASPEAFAVLTAAQQTTLPPTMTPDAARALVAAHRPTRLWLARDGVYAAVLKTPDAAQWIAAVAQYDTAQRKNGAVVDAIDPFVLAAVVWSSEPLIGGAGLLDRCPAIIWDLWACYKRAGGDGAAARTFRL